MGPYFHSKLVIYAHLCWVGRIAIYLTNQPNVQQNHSNFPPLSFPKGVPDTPGGQVERDHPVAAVRGGRRLHTQDGQAGRGVQGVPIRPDSGGCRLRQESRLHQHQMDIVSGLQVNIGLKLTVHIR